ncbi:MAG: peptidoglycan-associated lipoprotein Pal [Candidatus Sulfotelmatobacter sp.]
MKKVNMNIKKLSRKQQTWNKLGTVVALAAVFMLGACHKATVPPPPPPPPASPSPTAAISVSPDTIQKGQSSTLTWQTTNATDVSIGGIGAVQPNGSQQVSPADSTTYHLTAKGAGGTQDATTRLTVTPPPVVQAPPPSPSDEDLFGQTIKDVYFDYDKSDIRGDQSASIQSDMLFLNQHPGINFTVEGHCDDRGSTEYNLALGDQRASSVKNALVTAGISASRIKTISYGKEKPFCMEDNEACWQQNRRGHFVYQK